MKKLFLLLLSLCYFIPTLSLAAISSRGIHIEWSYDYQPVEGKNLAGYHLYKEGVKVCTTNTPEDKAMDCDIFSETGTYSFTLTAFHSDDTESPHSPRYEFRIDEEQPPADDGSRNFIFSLEYPAEQDLAAVNTSGNETAPSNTLTYSTDAPPPSTELKAIITSNTTEGTAPLNVAFDSASSSGEISSFSWFFGDGRTSDTSIVDHQYIIPGTYTAQLTVADSSGNTSVNTIVISVTEGAPVITPPQAVISSSTALGQSPLNVSFNGNDSSAPSSEIISYQWTFGDSSSATGSDASHTFMTAGTFNTTLTITNSAGLTDSTSTPVIVTYPPPDENEPPEFNIELGEISVNSDWARVEITSSFQNPVVIAGPPSSVDSAPCVIRLRNISPTGFDIRITEWDYLDDNHVNETVSYIIMEKGRFTLPDGTQVEAGSFYGNTSLQQLTFSKAFDLDPVVVSTIASTNETDTISGRIRNISTSSFDYYFQKQEKNENTQATETINFIAWEQSIGTIDTLVYEVQSRPKSVTHSFYDIKFQSTFAMQPLFLADMQTTNDQDTAAVRLRNPTATGVQVKIEEEQSENDEVGHGNEVVGYLAIGSNEEKPIEPVLDDK